MKEFLNHHSATVLHPWAGAWLSLVIIGYDSNNLSPYAALAGAIVAVLGVLTLGRPIIRLGYSEWLRQSNTIDGGTYPPTIEEQKAALENERDAKSMQITGPLLISIGTLLNGASGFLS
ncbi:hypothetical protein [Chromatium okenii]|jgi:hypothetical protein|uniref:hypothetical protein n=1 Tax=Chromatium okenii TaxID=61644 RepID=UPI0026E97EF5|nr:hypothetical protein [Chromatium okenii]MBV5311518.1 hypothetical protein [Chromatium okenii]